MTVQGPVIVIGAGRSGSTLLNRVLNAHPKIVMHGELYELVGLLWQKFMACEPVVFKRSALEACHLRDAQVGAIDGSGHGALHALAEQERARIGRVIRQAVMGLLQTDTEPGCLWGFQEIWVSESGRSRWEGIDHAFPDAHFLHIVRHPLDFARSVADWHRRKLDKDELRENLSKWVEYRNANLARMETGRYTRIKYEDMIRDAQEALKPFLESVGLSVPWEAKHALEVRTKASDFRSALPADAECIMSEVSGLLEALDEEGYERVRPDLLVGDQVGATAVPLSEQEWLLQPPFYADGGHAWLSKIYSMPELLERIGAPDSSETPDASRLLLLEDGYVLGPAHSLHSAIRTGGCGRYSHWGDEPVLRFSTSDNSDPNLNGRRYSIIMHCTSM